MANNNKGGMFDYVSTITKAYNDRQDRKFDNKYRQDVLNLKVSEAMRNQANLDRNYDYQTGGEVINNPEIASFLGVDKGAQIPRSQLNMFFEKGITDYKKNMATEKIKITPTVAEMIGNKNLANSEVSREMLPLLNAVQNYYSKEKFYESTATKEREKLETLKQEASPVPMAYVGTDDLDTFSINEKKVSAGVTNYLESLNMADPVSGLRPFEIAKSKAAANKDDEYALYHLTQAENMLQIATTPGMNKRRWYGGRNADQAQWLKNTENQAENLIKEIQKARGMSAKKIQVHIDSLKNK